MDGRLRVGFGCGDHANAASGHTLGEAIAAAAGNENVGIVERMAHTVIEAMQGKLLRQIELPDLVHGGAVHLEDEEAPCPAGMACDLAEILAGDKNAQDVLLMPGCRRR